MQVLKLIKEDWPIATIGQSSFMSFKTCMACLILMLFVAKQQMEVNIRIVVHSCGLLL